MNYISNIIIKSHNIKKNNQIVNENIDNIEGIDIVNDAIEIMENLNTIIKTNEQYLILDQFLKQKVTIFKQIEKQQRICCIRKMQQGTGQNKYILRIKGEIFINENDNPECFYIIFKGSIGIYRYIDYYIKNRNRKNHQQNTFELIMTLKQGDCVGHLQIMSKNPFLHQMVFLEDTVYGIIKKQQFVNFVLPQSQIVLNNKIDMLKQSIVVMNPLDYFQQNQIIMHSFLFQSKRFNINEIIVNENEMPNNIYIIVDGLVEIKQKMRDQYGNQKIIHLARFSKGKLLNIYEMENNIPSDYIIICKEASKFLVLSMNSFFYLNDKKIFQENLIENARNQQNYLQKQKQQYLEQQDKFQNFITQTVCSNKKFNNNSKDLCQSLKNFQKNVVCQNSQQVYDYIQSNLLKEKMPQFYNSDQNDHNNVNKLQHFFPPQDKKKYILLKMKKKESSKRTLNSTQQGNVYQKKQIQLQKILSLEKQSINSNFRLNSQKHEQNVCSITTRNMQLSQRNMFKSIYNTGFINY